MKIKNKIKEIGILDIFLIVLIIVLCLIFSYINLYRYKQGLNSDIAAEGLLVREIWETKQWVPDTWYGSTEAKLLSNVIWAVPFYGMTGSMCIAMGWGCIIGMFLLLLCAGYMAKELEFSKTQKLLFLTLCLLVPNSMGEIQMIYTRAGYYVCHLGLFLGTMGWYVRMLKKQKKMSGIGLVIYVVHFLLGGQGVRGILMVSGPLFGVEMIRRVYLFHKDRKIDKGDNYITINVLLTVILGYLGGKLPFSVGQPMSRNIRNAPSKFVEQIIPHFLDAIWWNNLSVIEKISMFVCLGGVIYLTITVVVKGVKKKEIKNEEWIIFSCVLSVVLTAMALTFTTIESANRYYVLIFFAIAIALGILWEKASKGKGAIIAIVLIMFVGNWFRVYWPAIESDNYQDNVTIQVAEYLEEQGYKQGYTTFEHANYMTVAVDGRVQVAAVNSMETMEISKWLTSATWYVPNASYESKTAYIVTESNLESFQEFYEQHINEIVYDTQIGIYHIYGSDYNYSKLTD